ncbi:MAG TPA: tetratricopeptide repeat protein, partial [Rhodocyclaceae bacterium]|nr:tetratricopeptide repeat protein [Rhodocyclaceae bacterium]
VVREIPSHAEAFSDCFETSLCCRFPGVIEKDVDCFNPLYALTTRLFDEDAGKSIYFSAGLFLPASEKATSAHDVVPPPLQPGLFSFPPTQRFATADFPYTLNPPYWAKDDPVSYMIDNADLLLKQGRVVWGAIVQANKGLYEPTYGVGYGGEVIYDPAGRLPTDDLVQVAQRLFALKGKPPHDPLLNHIATHLTEETTRAFGLDIPTTFCPQPVKLSSTYFDQLFLPDGMLTLPFFPLLISEQCPGAVMLLPWQLWPEGLAEYWLRVSEEKFGMRHSSEPWRAQMQAAYAKETEQRERHALLEQQGPDALFEEGVRYFSGRGVAQDYTQARILWESAALANHARSLNNLGTMFIRGLGIEASPERGFAFYLRAAMEGLALGQLNLAKMYLDGIGTTPDRASAQRWLLEAAGQNNAEASKLLSAHFGAEAQ